MRPKPPFSMFKRGVWTNALLMSVVLVSSMALSGYLVVWPLMQVATRDFSGLLVDSARIWTGLPAARRTAFEESLRRTERIELGPANGEIPTSGSSLPYFWMLEMELSERLGRPVKIAAARDGNYAVDLPLPEGTLRARFSKARIGTNPVAAMFVTLLSSFLLAWLAALLATKRLIRPLHSLSEAARTVAQGRVATLPPPEARELEEVIASFNAMARDVRDLVQRRNAMLAGISHDLRSPIARMRMALELARESSPPEYLDAMERYLEQMNRMIGEFLDFSRGVARTKEEKVELASLLDELGAAPLPAAGAQLQCDAGALRRVLGNLLQNARQHGGEERPAVAVRATAAKVEIDVLDRGPGIPEGDRKRLFDPFERGDSARSRPGAGLGLAIVREICQAQGWEIDLLDRPGGGLVARLVVPVRPAQANPDSP